MSFYKTIFSGALLAIQINSTTAQTRHRNTFDVNGLPTKLVLEDDNRFRIMQVTDLHLGEDIDEGWKTFNFLMHMFGEENPDFIAITGDLVAG